MFQFLFHRSAELCIEINFVLAFQQTKIKIAGDMTFNIRSSSLITLKGERGGGNILNPATLISASVADITANKGKLQTKQDMSESERSWRLP